MSVYNPLLFLPAIYFIDESPSLIELINHSSLNAQYYNFNIFAMSGSSALFLQIFFWGGAVFYFFSLPFIMPYNYFLISIHKRNCCKQTFSNRVLRSWERGSIL